MFLLAAALLLLHFSVFSQTAELNQTADPEADAETLTPFIKSLSIGVEVWPITKERLRLGYHWEWKPNRQWMHELAYFNASSNIFNIREDWWEDRVGNLQGVQLKNELRFYHRNQGPAYWYHGASFAYLYSEHTLTKGMECEDTGWGGGCAYFRSFNPLVAHSGTIAGNFGLVLTTNGILHFNFFSSLGLRGTYFPVYKSDAYFGRGMTMASGEHYVLEPYLHLGVNLFFALQKRKEQATGLQNQ
ncbi:hypothetical protein D770_26500 [Flammeovirgaceae bacterium 311]|nr:hypothetical protein D770_26500 [Flammeovirgaceae bacterium 311]